MHSLLLSAVFLSFSYTVSGCIASGICGMAGGCGYAPPAQPPACNPGCGPGYGCGSYGCYRVKAKVHSSKTLLIPDQDDLVKLTPDQKFTKCCEDRHLPDECMNKCNYVGYSKEAFRAMYFKMDKCPQQAAADIHFCAAQGRDHTTCCKNNAVGTTLAGNKCLTFCDQTPGKVTQLDLTYIACYHRFDQMKTCFYQDVSEGPGARLPPISVPAEASHDDDSFHVEREEEPQTTRTAHASRAKTFLG